MLLIVEVVATYFYRLCNSRFKTLPVDPRGSAEINSNDLGVLYPANVFPQNLVKLSLLRFDFLLRQHKLSQILPNIYPAPQ